jgi:hypothetical protein
MTMALQEPFPAITDDRQLKLEGFSREQIAGLIKVRALYQRGAYHEANPEQKRLEFVRWLYLQGRLES